MIVEPITTPSPAAKAEAPSTGHPGGALLHIPY